MSIKRRIIAVVLALPLTMALLSHTPDSKPAAAAGPRDQMAEGKKVYMKYCVSCHQADGGGVPNLNPPLIKTVYVLGPKPRLIKIVLNGSNENLEIDGETYSNPMPQLDILKDQEIADVLTYVRNSFGNKAPAIQAAEVKALRKAKK